MRRRCCRRWVASLQRLDRVSSDENARDEYVVAGLAHLNEQRLHEQQPLLGAAGRIRSPRVEVQALGRLQQGCDGTLQERSFEYRKAFVPRVRSINEEDSAVPDAKGFKG